VQGLPRRRLTGAHFHGSDLDRAAAERHLAEHHRLQFGGDNVPDDRLARIHDADHADRTMNHGPRARFTPGGTLVDQDDDDEYHEWSPQRPPEIARIPSRNRAYWTSRGFDYPAEEPSADRPRQSDDAVEGAEHFTSPAKSSGVAYDPVFGWRSEAASRDSHHRYWRETANYPDGPHPAGLHRHMSGEHGQFGLLGRQIPEPTPENYDSLERLHDSAHDREDGFFGNWAGHVTEEEPRTYDEQRRDHPDENDHYRAYEGGEEQPHRLVHHLMNDHAHRSDEIDETRGQEPSMMWHDLVSMHRYAHAWDHDQGFSPWGHEASARRTANLGNGTGSWLPHSEWRDPTCGSPWCGGEKDHEYQGVHSTEHQCVDCGRVGYFSAGRLDDHGFEHRDDSGEDRYIGDDDGPDAPNEHGTDIGDHYRTEPYDFADHYDEDPVFGHRRKGRRANLMTTERAFTRRMHEAASGLPQVQEVTDPNNGPDPQGDQLPPDVMFPLDPAFGQQWVTGPRGAQPHGATASLEKTAAKWSKKHYEHLAETIGGIHDDDHRAAVAHLFAGHLPGTDPNSSLGPMNRERFEQAANIPNYRGNRMGQGWHGGEAQSGYGGKHPGFTLGHHDAVADILRMLPSVQHPHRAGGTYTPADVSEVADHFARRMNDGSAWTANGNRTFRPGRFDHRVNPSGNLAESEFARPDRSQERTPAERGSYSYSPPSHPGPMRSRQTSDEYGERVPEVYVPHRPSDLVTHPTGTGGGARQQMPDKEDDVEYDPIFGWRGKASLARSDAGRGASGDPQPVASRVASLGPQVATIMLRPRETWTGSQFRIVADFMSRPHQSTDDLHEPFNSAETTPPSQDAVPSSYQEGFKEGQQDRAAGEKPSFSDNSSHVSPYVSGYAAGFGGGSPASGAMGRDVPRSMGGDSGQPLNDQAASASWQVAQAVRRTAPIHVSAAFVSSSAAADLDFRKGYGFASRWKAGQRLVSQGSAAFEAGLYAGVSDRPRIQGAWLSAHQRMASRQPAMRKRLKAHAAFTRRMAEIDAPDVEVARNGWYLTAATSTDLITDGPGTSPDPMGNTPLNGPGAPPPMGGGEDPARSGGPSPYQGAEPTGHGPVAPDDVMGMPQEQPRESGPFTQTFSGRHPGNANLAPAAPNAADGPGYENRDAYAGDPRMRQQAFRQKVQASLLELEAAAPGSRRLDGAVHRRLRDAWNDWSSGVRDHPHATSEEIAKHPSVAPVAGPAEVEQSLSRLRQAGRARRGAGAGTWEINPGQGIATGQI
jgi:hypothetical protein